MTSTQQDYSKIITTVNSVTQNISIIPDQHNVIVIDTSENRLGINTINPQHSIDVRDNTDISGIIHSDHIKTSTVMSDLTPDIDICYNLGSQNNRWKNIYVNNIVSQQHTVDTMTIGGNTINIRNDAGNIVPALGYNETENKVELKSDIYAQDIDLDNIHIRNPSGLTFNSENVSDSDTIAFPTNIDISKNLVVNGDSQFLGKVSVKDNANDLILIDKTNPNIILINLQENQQVKINGKLLVTGEIDNDYLIQLIQGQTSSIRVNNDRILNKTNFYTLYDGLSQLDVTLDINSSNDVSFNAYKSLNDISCGFTDYYSNYNGYNIFFTNQSYDDIKLLSNDRKHLSYYNQFDLSSSDFSIIYNDGSELFYEIHNNTIKVLETDSNYLIQLNVSLNVLFKQKIKGNNYYIDVALINFDNNNLNDHIPYTIVEQQKYDINLTTNTVILNYQFQLDNQVIQANSRYGLGFLIYVEDDIYGQDVSGINNYYNNQYFSDNSNNIDTIYDKTIDSYYKKRVSNYTKSSSTSGFNYFYSKYNNRVQQTSYSSGRGYDDYFHVTGYYGFNILFQYLRTGLPAYDTIETLSFYDLINFNNQFFTNLQTPNANSINVSNNYKLLINKSGRYLINFRIKGEYQYTSGINTVPYNRSTNQVPTDGNYYNRHGAINIALLKNVDTDITLVKDISNGDIYYSQKGNDNDDSTQLPTVYYDFQKNCYIDLSENDTLSIGMLHRNRGNVASQGHRISGDEQINYPYVYHSTIGLCEIAFNITMSYYIDQVNYFSIIRMDQDIDLDIEIPINSIDYKIQKADTKSFTEINIENSLTLNTGAVLRATNIDFSGIPNDLADVSSGYLYQDNGFIKIKP